MDALFLIWFVLLVATFTPLISGGQVVDVRLVNGSSRYEGTVEYTTDNITWQTTCGVSFDFVDAKPVCEHIGAYGTNRAIKDSPFGSDLGEATTFLNCQGDDTAISDCELLTMKSCSAIGAAICYDETYLGCYENAQNDYVLTGDRLIEDSAMTIDKCITHCRESTMADYVYAGVEYGEECYCGVAGADYSRLRAAENGDGDCQSQCTGDANSSCGGLGHIAVFQIPESSQPVTSPTIVIVTTEDADTSSDLTSNIHETGSTTPYDATLSSTTPTVTRPVGNTSNLGVAAGAGGGAATIVIILVVIIVVVVLYKRRHGRSARRASLPHQPPDKFDANNYDEILMDSTVGKGEPTLPHRYEDSIKCGVSKKEPQLNMGFVKDKEDLSALYAVSTKHRAEPEGADLGDLYAMPDKRKKSHVMRNGASKAMEPSTQESTPPGMDALYAMPDKKKKVTDDNDEDGTEMVENPIYT